MGVTRKASFRVVLPVLLAWAVTVPVVAGVSAQCRQRGQAALTAWTQGHYQKAARHFAPDVAKHVSPAMLKASWQQIGQQAGDFVKLGRLSPRTIAGQKLLAAPVAFAHARLLALVACDAEDRISTFRLVPAPPSPPSAASSATPGSPVVDQVSGVVSHAVQVPSPLGPLAGLLDMPEGAGPFPVVVLVAGSGPNDLNEHVGPNRPFRDIAVGLARQGVASLRFDKRVHDYPAKMRSRMYTADDDETDDALSALKLAAGEKHIDPTRLFVLGHSEGAMLAPRIARRAGDLAGVIMLAAPARPLLDLLADQYRTIAKADGWSSAKLATREKAIDNERTLLAHADSAHPPKGTFGSWPQSFWLSLHDYDQVAVAKSLHVPMLILQGGKDYQILPTKDFDAWKKALAGHKHVTFHLYPGLFHLFMPAKTGTPADYKVPGHVSKQVIGDMATWIKSQRATTRGGSGAP